MEGLQQAVRHVDDDSLAGATVDIDLLGTSDVEVTQVTLELGIGSLKVKKGLDREK